MRDERRVNENTLKHALKLKSERILGVEHPTEMEGEEKLASKVFAELILFTSEKSSTHRRHTERIPVPPSTS